MPDDTSTDNSADPTGAAPAQSGSAESESKRPVRRRRATRAAAAPEPATDQPPAEPTSSQPAEASELVAPKRPRRTRKSTAAAKAETPQASDPSDKPDTSDKPEQAAQPVDTDAAAEAPAKAPPRKRASRSRAKSKTADEAAPAEGTSPPAEASSSSDKSADGASADGEKPATRRRRVSIAMPFDAPPIPEAAQTSDGPRTSAAADAAPALFVAPDAVAAPRRRSRAKAADADASDGTPDATEDNDTTDGDGAEAADGDSDGSGTRRRRRGRRGRGRGKSGDSDQSPDNADDASTGDSTDSSDDNAGADSDDDSAEDNEDSDTAGGTRRRRRRRRGGNGGSDGGSDNGTGNGSGSGSGRGSNRGSSKGSDKSSDKSSDNDPPNTVTHVRDGAAAADDAVRGVKGSTRLEAKRQRRRDGRDQGRRRQPVVTESEFLARRESVDRAMVVRKQGESTEIAVLEDEVLVEHYVTRASSDSYAGNVYLGKVQNVLPSMEAAFIDIGKGRNAVLYAGEVNWDTAGMNGKPRRIEEALKSGQSVLVQVTKDPIGHKGARLTSQVSLAGRFLVYVPEGSMTGISRKLPEVERKRLKDILKKVVPDDAGVIIRTAAEGASEDEITSDVERLQAQWEAIEKKAAKGASAPAMLYEEPDLAIRVVRDVFNEDFDRMVVSGNDAWDTIHDYVSYVAPDMVARLSHHTGESDIFADLRVDEQLAKGLDRKVYLPSGGSLVMDRTEAMTVVDVNTGKFTGRGGNLEETVTRNNLEAAEEIVRQLRLRDVGGIIVIDFIDMVLESNRDLVLRRLTECLGRDRTRHQVAEVTSLGLVQMTRKRVGQGLLEAFSEECEACNGRGVIVQSTPVYHHDDDGGDSSGSGSGPGSGGRRRKGRGSRSEGSADSNDSDGSDGSTESDDSAAIPSPAIRPGPPRTPRPAPQPDISAEPADDPSAVVTSSSGSASADEVEPEDVASAAALAAGNAGEVETGPDAEIDVEATPRRRGGRRRSASRPAGPPVGGESAGAAESGDGDTTGEPDQV